MAWFDFLRRGRGDLLGPPQIVPLDPPKVAPSLAKQATVGGGIIAATIAAALGYVYVKEGGYVNHPNDRGGATRYGITQATAREFGYKGSMRDFPKHCDAQNPVCADLIYTVKYIDRPGYRPLAGLSRGVLFEVVDSAVLHGPSRSSRWFQQSLNEVCGTKLKVDGKVGPRTVAAFEECQFEVGRLSACRGVVHRMDAKQEAFFRAIVRNNPSQRVFLKGWVNQRVGNVNVKKDCV